MDMQEQVGEPVSSVSPETNNTNQTAVDSTGEDFSNNAIETISSLTSTSSPQLTTGAWCEQTPVSIGNIVSTEPNLLLNSVSERALAGGPVKLNIDTDIRHPLIPPDDPPSILPFGAPNPFLNINHFNRFWPWTKLRTEIILQGAGMSRNFDSLLTFSVSDPCRIQEAWMRIPKIPGCKLDVHDEPNYQITILCRTEFSCFGRQLNKRTYSSSRSADGPHTRQFIQVLLDT